MANDNPASPTNDKPSGLSLKKKIFFSALVVILVLAAGEAVLRIREAVLGRPQFPLPQDRLLYTQKSFVRFALKPNADIVSHSHGVRINSLGFRGPQFDEKKPPDVIRIVCTGGSTTFGTTSSDYEHTYPAQLEKILSQGRSNIQVINAGVPAYNLCDSLVDYEARLSRLDATAIVVYHGINDLMLLSNPNAPVSYHSIQPFQFEDENEGFFAGMKRCSILWRKSAGLFKGISSSSIPSTGIAENKPGLSADARLPLARKLFRQNLEFFCRIAGRDHEIVLVTFRLSYRPDMPEEEKARLVGMKAFFSPYLDDKETYEWIQAFNEEIKEIGEKYGCCVVDAASTVAPGAENFVDIVHFTDAGSLRLAEAVAAKIIEEKIID